MKVIVIGAGASGLMTSIVAARQGHEVLVLEANDRPGKKLLATGNGRCNYSNIDIKINRFHGINPKFAYSAISKFSYEDAREFFEGLGMDTVTLSKGRAYPRSLKSSSVLEVLLLEARNQGVKIAYGERVGNIIFGNGFEVKTEASSYKSQALVMAGGGMSLKNSGSDGSSYDLARSLGHRITDLGPGIVQLKLKGQGHKKMSGTRFEALVKLYDKEKFIHQDEDEVLFTDYGISGPAILQLSRRALEIIKAGSRAYLFIDLFPEYSHEDLTSKLAYEFALGKNSLEEALIGKINKALISQALQGLDLKEKTKNLSFSEVDQVAARLKNWKFEISTYKDMDGAQVTVGGVDTRDIDPSTMESRLVEGLYFVGEIVDIDADCGGFNLHWAWASAQLAGSSIRG